MLVLKSIFNITIKSSIELSVVELSLASANVTTIPHIQLWEILCPYVSVLSFAAASANTRRGRNTRGKKYNIKIYASKMLPI